MEFLLRRYQETDAEDFFEYSNNPKLRKNMSDGFPKTLEACRAFVKEFADKPEEGHFLRAVVIDGRMVGSAGCFITGSDCADIGYWIGEAYWRKGIMSRVLTELCQEAFQTFAIDKIYAKPYTYNEGSRKLLEKLGFKQIEMVAQGVVKDGEKIDYYNYVLAREEL